MGGVIMEKIQKIMLERHGKIETAYQDYQNNPFDPEKAHQLRVRVRKIRALLNILKPLISTENYDPLNQNLRQVAQVYETIRELDVLVAHCGQVAEEQPNLSEHYAAMFNFLLKERRKEIRRTLNKTNTKQVQETLEEVESFIKQLAEHIEEEGPNSQAEWSNYVTERIEKKDKKMRRAYKKVDETDHEAVHQTRLMAKKLRYAANYLDKLTEVKTKPLIKRAKAIQNEFGERTDQQVNITLLKAYAEKAEKPAVKALLMVIREDELAQLAPTPAD